MVNPGQDKPHFLDSGGYRFVSGNTVYRSRVMGIYVRTGSSLINTYLAAVQGR